MAKKDIEQPQQTMEDFLLAQLNEEVILKDGTQLKAADGHVMADRDGMQQDIMTEGRLLEKWDKNRMPYKESNPLYVHLKELQRSIGMQREHLGLTAKSSKKMESPKTHDVKDDPLGEYFEGIR